MGRQGAIVAMIAVCAASVLFIASESLPAQNEPEGRKVAFLVGVKDYDHSDLKNLDFPENDVEELAALLNTQGFETVLLTTSRGRKSELNKPTAEIIRRRLDTTLRGLTKRDLLIVGLAGHGLQLVGKKEAYFCPCDANPRAAGGKFLRPETLLGLDEVLAQFRTTGAGYKLLLVDACRNDPEVRGVADLEAVVPAQTGILLSCKPGEFAFEDKSLGRGHGVFFYHVIEGLKGLAQEKGTSEITWDGLSHYVQTQVPKTVHSLFGKQGGDQNPNLMANIAGVPPILARAAAAAIAPPFGTPEVRKPSTLKAFREFAAPLPTGQQVLRAVSAMLPRYHLSRRQVDDDVSRRWLANFLHRLDPDKAYFYQADVDRFVARQDELDDLARQGDMSFAYEIVKIYRQRVDDRTRLANEFLAAKQDFTVDEEIVTDPERLNYPATTDDAREIWRKRIKLDLLTEKARGIGSMEAQVKLGLRYSRLRRQAYQYDEGDILEMYVTSLAQSYDSHSRYIPADGVDALAAKNTMQSEGAGFGLQAIDDDFVVNEVTLGSPAGKDGRLRAGDRLIGVGEGESGGIAQIAGMKLGAVRALLQGKKGTIVRLHIVPVGKKEAVVYNIVRGEFQLNEARGSIITRKRKADGLPLRVGYISLPRFYASSLKFGNGNRKSASSDLRRILADPERGFKAAGVEVVLIDLRANSGGIHNEGVKLAGLFIGPGPVAQVRDAEGRVTQESSQGEAVWTGPVVVLTSRHTAGVAQSFAAALQDYGRGLIVGDSGTMGDGTGNSTFDVGLFASRGIDHGHETPADSSQPSSAPKLGSLQVIVRQNFRLNGDSLQLRGIRPDVVLPSLTDRLKVGEAFLPHTIPFDRVEPIHHANFDLINADQRVRLQGLADERCQKSARFKRLVDEMARLEARSARKAISLNEAKASEELKAIGSSQTRRSVGQEFEPTYYNDEVLAVTADYLRLCIKNSGPQLPKPRRRRVHASWGWEKQPGPQTPDQKGPVPAQPPTKQPAPQQRPVKEPVTNDSGTTRSGNKQPPSDQLSASIAPAAISPDSNPPGSIPTGSQSAPPSGKTEPALLIAPFDAARVQPVRAAWAEYQHVVPQYTNSLGMELALIPAGQFAMGSPDAANGEFPVHPVTISRPFFLAKYEVTKGQFKKFVQETSYVTDAEADGGANWGYTATAANPFQTRPEFNWSDWGVDQSDASPVVNVSWDDAMAFCYWLGQKEGKVYRLPTEAEWEYACRGGTTSRYYNGDDPEGLTQIGNVWDAAGKAQIPALANQVASSDGWAFTCPSGKFQPNSFGLYDMTGNAREWCADWYNKDYYASSPERDPTGPPSGIARVSRGGGWNSPAAQCSSARRGYGEPNARDFNLGFRVVQGGIVVQTGWTAENWERQIHRTRLQINGRRK